MKEKKHKWIIVIKPHETGLVDNYHPCFFCEQAMWMEGYDAPNKCYIRIDDKDEINFEKTYAHISCMKQALVKDSK